jgi:3-oxoacyl-(acyl-carrier-protein) synthase
LPCPVGITGVGCVLPGALDPESYWRNVLAGVSGISEQEPLTTEAWDAATPSNRPNAIAWGSLGELEYDPRLPFTRAEFEHLTRTQRLVALAARQCMSRLPARTGATGKSRRERWILGASAEGMRECEELALLERLRELVARLDEPESLRNPLGAQLDEVAWAPLGAADSTVSGPSANIRAVVERFTGIGERAADVALVDAACASSLYAIDLGIESLRSGDSDLVIVGGVFAPGAGWHPLYALFEGLIASGSFPFDRRADGVVFGEGAALVALQRLPDAFATGARIHAVIRGVGLSGDGTRASVSEPRAQGQALAMRRAYDSAGVDPRTVQLIEGHGVSNPGFDAAELEALRSMFIGVDSTLSPRPLESVKGLIGHTVWASGAASVIKICRALEEHVVPPQHTENGSAPDPDPQLEGSGFQIPVSARSWPPNADGEPRRAGVSAFGLGGTNAHVVVESFSPSYHERLAAKVRVETSRAPMAVAGVAAMFPGVDENTLMDLPEPAARVPAGRRLGRAALRALAPAELRADVVDQLDVSQLASIAGAEKALARLPGWRGCRERLGVVAGMVGRTARALAASERLYRDELQRLLTTSHGDLGLERADAERVARKLHQMIGSTTAPLTPHTLMGLLPNIAAARVAALFDLHGPNLVIDAGDRSILEVLAAANRWLERGAADVMLACLLRLEARDRPRADEAALVLALTTPAFARDHSWQILAELVVGAHGEDKIGVQPSLARSGRPSLQLDVPRSPLLAGLDELARALDGAMRGEAATVRWTGTERGVPAPPHDGLATGTPSRAIT